MGDLWFAFVLCFSGLICVLLLMLLLDSLLLLFDLVWVAGCLLWFGWSDWLGAVVLRFWVGVSGWFWGFVSVVILLLCLRLVVINSVVLIKFYFYLIKF